MSSRGDRLLLALSGAASITGTVVFVVVSASDGRTLAPGNVPWAAFPIVWGAIGAVGALVAGRRDGANLADIQDRIQATAVRTFRPAGAAVWIRQR